MESPASDDLPETPAAETSGAEAPAVDAPVTETPVTETPVTEVSVPDVTEPEVAASEPAVSAFGVGPTLRAARESKGKSLADCSKQLRIRLPFLEALEDGRHRDLPGGTYAAGFLRSYAEYLNLDGEELVRRFRLEGAGGFTNRTELAFPSPVSEGRIPGGAVIFLGVILAGLAYGGWYFLGSHETKVAEMVPPLPDRLSTMLARQAALTGDAKPQQPAAAVDSPPPASDAARPPEEVAKVKEDVVPPPEAEEEKAPSLPAAPVETAAAQPEAAKPEPVKPAPAKVETPKVEPAKTAKATTTKPDAAKPEPAKAEPPKPEPAKPEVAKAEPPKPEAAAAPAAAGDGKVFGTEYGDARVVIKATGDDCWVQVREMDGSLLMSRLLRRGDSYRVPNRPGLNLMVGNAGSLEVSVDGRKVPALGAVGQVRRDIRLDPDKLQTGG